MICLKPDVHKYGSDEYAKIKRLSLTEYLLPFVDTHINDAARFVWNVHVPFVHTRYLDLVLELIEDKNNEGMSFENMLKVIMDIKIRRVEKKHI